MVVQIQDNIGMAFMPLELFLLDLRLKDLWVEVDRDQLI